LFTPYMRPFQSLTSLQKPERGFQNYMKSLFFFIIILTVKFIRYSVTN
jgi:hypothetical protein